MNTRKAKKILKEIARQEGVSLTTVYEEINTAIQIGISDSDSQAHTYWQKLFPGQTPTPEELITILSKEVKKM